MYEEITTYGLIGYPLGHSLSPVMHNAAFEMLGVEAVYKLFPLEENQLDGFFSDVKSEGSPIFGLNVTIPYKEKVIPFLDNLSPFAKKVMAVNTVVIGKDRKLTGFNTDGPGFISHLSELGVATGGKRIALLGAGGAARSLISVLCIVDERPASIKVFDIDRGKVEELIRDLSGRIDLSIVERVDSIDDLETQQGDMLINATPVGMKKEDPCLIDSSLMHEGLFVYDLIYNPCRTPLLTLAQEHGARISNGLGMLFYQGVLAFQHWADTELSQEVTGHMRSALEGALGT